MKPGQTMEKGRNTVINSEDNLKEIAPRLFSAGNDNRFDVPENYFDSLPAMIIERLAIPEKTNYISKFKTVFNPRYLIPATVSIAVLFIAIMIYNASDVKTANKQTLAFTETNNSAEVMYMDSLIDIGELDESILIETVAGINDTSKNVRSNSTIEKNISDLNKSNIILNDSTDKVIITDDDIINYLLENDEGDDIINY